MQLSYLRAPISEALKLRTNLPTKVHIPGPNNQPFTGHYKQDPGTYDIYDLDTKDVLKSGTYKLHRYQIDASPNIAKEVDAVLQNDHTAILYSKDREAITYLDGLTQSGKLRKRRNKTYIPTNGYYQQVGINKYKSDELALPYKPYRFKGYKDSAKLPDYAINSLMKAIDYHGKHFDGQRWPELEDALLRRADLITNFKKSDHTRPRTSIFRYMNQINDRWPEGEKIAQDILNLCKSEESGWNRYFSPVNICVNIIKYQIRHNLDTKQCIDTLLKSEPNRLDYNNSGIKQIFDYIVDKYGLRIFADKWDWHGLFYQYLIDNQITEDVYIDISNREVRKYFFELKHRNCLLEYIKYLDISYPQAWNEIINSPDISKYLAQQAGRYYQYDEGTYAILKILINRFPDFDWLDVYLKAGFRNLWKQVDLDDINDEFEEKECLPELEATAKRQYLERNPQ